MRKATKTRIIVSAVAAIILSVITSFLVLNEPTHASTDSLGRKWFLADHYNCVFWSASENINVSGTIDTRNSWNTVEELMYRNSGASQPTPNFGYLGVSGNITCRDVLDGTSDMKGYNGVLKNIALNPKTEFDKISESQMKSLGYTPKAADVIMISKKAWSTNNILGVKLEDPGYLKVNSGPSNSLSYSIEDEGDLGLNLTGNQPKILNIDYEFSISDVRGHDLTAPFFALVPWVCAESSDSSNVSVELPTNGSVADAVNAINLKVSSIKAWVQRCTRSAIDLSGLVSEEHEVNEGLEASVSNSEGYTLGDRKAAADQSISRLSGNGNTSNLQPTEDEYYDLYYYYLKNSVFGGENDPLSNGSLSCTGGNGYTEIHLKADDGKYHRYYINNNKKTNDDFKSLYINGEGFPVFYNVKIDDLIGWFRDYHQVEVEDADGTCPAPADTEKKDSGKTGEDECFTAADSLGWIVCPIIKGASAAVNTIYDDIIEPFLAINVSSFDTGNGAYQAWQFFQSIANIVFVILFLVVIISQITGVGIDNLGIKRILPKLIVAAILVNLSYIICTLLIDVSNIAGYGFKRFFDSISISGVQGGATGGTVIGNLLAVLGLAGGAAVIAWTPALVPAILLGILSLLISILTMFVILGVYQAGVIIAVVVSPVAFVLYMLPNTKPIFDRWRKLFQALLLLYPLCGLMMGGAAFAGKVIQSVADGFWFTLLGALLSVIPFFFIPKILQSSMSAMGNIGAKISGIGKGLSGKTTGAIQNSEAYKDMMARRAAGVNRNGDLTARGKLMRRMAKGKVGPDGKEKKGIIARAATRQLARGQVGYRKREDEITKGATLLDPNNMAAQDIAQQKAVEKEALAAQMALVNDETRNGEDEGTLYQMFDEAVSSGNATRARAITEIAGRRKDSASRFAEKLKKDSIEGKYANAEGSEMLRSISKQIATGDNSKNFREGNAGGFEFAARTNDGSNTVYNYADWISDGDNVKRVTDNYLNTPEGLASQTNASLREFSGEAVKDKATGKVLYQANISKAKDSLAKTANKYYENQKVGGVYYSDKEDNMAKIRDLKSSSPGALPIDSGDDAGDAKEDQSYKVQ